MGASRDHAHVELHSRLCPPPATPLLTMENGNAEDDEEEYEEYSAAELEALYRKEFPEEIPPFNLRMPEEYNEELENDTVEMEYGDKMEEEEEEEEEDEDEDEDEEREYSDAELEELYYQEFPEKRTQVAYAGYHEWDGKPFDDGGDPLFYLKKLEAYVTGVEDITKPAPIRGPWETTSFPEKEEFDYYNFQQSSFCVDHCIEMGDVDEKVRAEGNSITRFVLQSSPPAKVNRLFE